jgi:hypothetical protein
MNPIEDTSPDSDKALEDIKRMCSQLMEIHGFDSIQVLATKYSDKDGTQNIVFGIGNFYAIYGLCKSWTLRHEGEELNHAKLIESMG